ncbi:MAG: MFS transporter [Lysobacterales bacterium]|nr:MAG: MFS transporter [Xanthomonadales bacterium]
MTHSRRLAFLVLLCAAVTVGVSFGIRHSFGLFMRPIPIDLGWGRESLSLVIAVQALLNGVAAPFAGALSDKWGPARTVMLGGIFYTCGLLVMSQSVTVAGMLFGGGLLAGMGLSACGLPVLLSVVGRAAPEHKRSLWLGIVTAGATAGQLVIIPITQWTIEHHGWSVALVVLAAAAVLILPLALCLGLAGSLKTETVSQQSLGEALVEARAHSGYILLTLGFFVCGFQVQFIASHLPAFVEDQGLGLKLAASTLVIIAFFNMFGAWTAGYLGGMLRKKYLLTGIYLVRSVLISAFVLLPVTEASVLVFSAVMGFIWLGTVPLTSGLIAQVFGPRYMATLYAIVYLSHQVGNFCGAWAGGRVFDATGSYEAVWWIAASLGVVAAILHFPMDDKPIARSLVPARA